MAVEIKRYGNCPLCERLVNSFDGKIEPHTPHCDQVELCKNSNVDVSKINGNNSK